MRNRLTPKECDRIRHRYKKGGLSYKNLAGIFGVSAKQVELVVKGYTPAQRHAVKSLQNQS